MPNLLIEVGVEELPLDSLNVIYDQLKGKLEDALKTARLMHGTIQVEATPRRIALHIEGLSARQSDQTLEFSGPSVEKAYENGAPTKALEGFVRSKGATLEEVEVRDTPKGKFVFITRHEKGKPLAAVLGQILSDSLTSLPFPKLMRWEKSNFRFPRPIRWIVAYLDKKVLNWTLAGIKAGSKSRGHRFLGKEFKILSSDWAAYSQALRKQSVILSLEERKAAIRKYFKHAEADSELVHLNANLIESPYFVEGKFRLEYLKLPSEVLVNVMKKHQKIFAIHDASGKMTNKFSAVLNGKRGNLTRIRSDFENVLESRLKDADFFYKEDTKTPLSDKVSKLDQITYLGKYGTMKGKTDRLVEVVSEFCSFAPGLVNEKALKEAAGLCKADLVTHLVYEMPELQGIAGREYAIQSKVNKEIADAIGSQYLPKNLSESYADLSKQMSALGAALGILDRVDLLVGAFMQGMEPTGSQDPFALRRAGGIVVKLIRAFNIAFSIKKLIHSFAAWGTKEMQDGKEQKLAKLEKFLKERIQFELGVSAGTRDYEIAQAVMSGPFDDIADIFQRYEAMKRMFEKDPKTFIQAAKVVERAANILKGSKSDPGPVKADLLHEPLEKSLFQVLEAQSSAVEKAIGNKDYEGATRLFGKAFFVPLNEFFSKVMVNAEDPEIRRNRHALMKRIDDLYARKLADLSVLSRIDEQ